MKKNNKKGFTLVELVIVVAVMAVLVAVAIPTVKSITQTAKDATYNTNCRTIESMLKLAEAEEAKAGDGAGTLDKDEVATALTAAKLGLKANDGTFFYTPGSGIVDNVGVQGDIKITFDNNGGVSTALVGAAGETYGDVNKPANNAGNNPA